MMKAIVFGANGYLGSHLIYFLLKSAYKIRAFDIQDSCKNLNVDYRKLDITLAEEFENIDWNVDYVFMFAGLTGTHNGFNEYESFIKVNETGLINVLDSIVKSEFRPRVLYPSTRLVYKGSDTPLTEDDSKDPKTIYAINKLACENILKVYSNYFNINYTVYRICVPYGNSLNSNYSYGTIGFFLDQVKKSNTINLYGDGSLRRTFTNIEYLCQQILGSCESAKSLNQIYNIKGEDYSLKELALLIVKKYHAKVTFSEWRKEDYLIESGHTVFNAEKISKSFNIETSTTFEDWLANIEND